MRYLKSIFDSMPMDLRTAGEMAKKRINAAIDAIDTAKVAAGINEMATKLQAGTSNLVSKIKTLAEKHVVEIPFDSGRDNLTFKIEDGALSASVDSKDGTSHSETRITIPEGIDTNNIHQTYDKERKVMVFKFGKLSK